MKKWKCTVCGYIHKGDSPPENCPVCNAPSSKFIELVEENTAEPETKSESEARTSPEPEIESVNPEPETKVSMDESIEEEKTGTKKIKAGFEAKLAIVNDLILKHHVHPISVHIPNGVLPISVVFVILSALFNSQGLAQAAFYNLIFVVLTMPLTLYTGYVEWQNHYNSAKTNIFMIKIGCAAAVAGLSFILMVWRIADPEVMTQGSLHLWTYVGLHIVMLAAAGTAGFIGGKLVFKEF